MWIYVKTCTKEKLQRGGGLWIISIFREPITIKGYTITEDSLLFRAETVSETVSGWFGSCYL